ncbi:MAG TPA: UbiD family decarboxylase [Anaerolineales bacterium]|jgi:UbiD family decarboxylase|nr:UbiD family decarboxylase [Anaerolineales bacterium]
MSFRSYLNRLHDSHRLVRVSAPISKDYEIAGVLHRLEPQPVLFENVTGFPFLVTANLFCSKGSLAEYFGVPTSGLIPLLAAAVDRRSPGRVVVSAPCQEVVLAAPDLDCLPILSHLSGDGGPYISAGVVVARHPLHGQNLDFHRCMQFSPTEMAVRVVRSRHFDAYLQELGQVDVAVCLGSAPGVLLAAATSLELGVDELEIANALEPLDLVRAKTVDLYVPAESEFVLEGTVYRDRRHAEGPFVDLTETQDVVRQEPVLVVKTVTHRHDAIWQALLPGRLEHKLLMGLPREPTIFRKVNQVVRCLDVNVDPGGCSWLHAVVQIDKQSEDDGRKAIQAAFAGHRSCKHVFVVDRDIDIYNPLEVEWALATRFQGDRDLVILPRESGSSLDPSAEPGTHSTTRIGFDLTKPLKSGGKSFERAAFPQVDLRRFLPNEPEAML